MFLGLQKGKKRRSKVHLLKQDVYKLCKLPLFVSCKRVLLYVTQHCNLQRATAFNCKVSHYNSTLFFVELSQDMRCIRGNAN